MWGHPLGRLAYVVWVCLSGRRPGGHGLRGPSVRLPRALVRVSRVAAGWRAGQCHMGMVQGAPDWASGWGLLGCVAGGEEHHLWAPWEGTSQGHANGVAMVGLLHLGFPGPALSWGHAYKVAGGRGAQAGRIPKLVREHGTVLVGWRDLCQACLDVGGGWGLPPSHLELVCLPGLCSYPHS